MRAAVVTQNASSSRSKYNVYFRRFPTYPVAEFL